MKKFEIRTTIVSKDLKGAEWENVRSSSRIVNGFGKALRVYLADRLSGDYDSVTMSHYCE